MINVHSFLTFDSSPISSFGLFFFHLCISLSRIVPCLMKECINTTMVPFVLPVILLVAERSSKEEFVEHILPHLRHIMKLTEPVQVCGKVSHRLNV